MKFSDFFTLFLVSSAVSAHPGGHGNEKMLEARKELVSRVSNLDHCHEKMAARGVHASAVERRSGLASNLSKRDLSCEYPFVYSGFISTIFKSKD